MILRMLVFFCVDKPVSGEGEDRSRTAETGSTSDYSSLRMTSLGANLPYDSLQPDPNYIEVR